MNEARGLRLALSGCGRMGRTRAAAVEKLGGCIEFYYDIDRKAAAEIARDAGRILGHPDELANEELDALFVCTPPGSRNTVELDCLAHGVPVLIEKPLGIDEDGARSWVRARGDHDTVAVVGYMNRQRASVLAAREVLREEGLIGLGGTWASGPYARDWWRDGALSGGPLNEQMTHFIDLMRFFGGDVELVTCLGAGPERDPVVASEAAIALKFEGGAVGTLLYTCRSEKKGIGLRLITPQRSLVLEGWDFRDPLRTGEDEEDAFLTETRGFLNAVRARKSCPPLVDIEDALATQLTVEAVKESLREGGRPVRIGS